MTAPARPIYHGFRNAVATGRTDGRRVEVQCVKCGRTWTEEQQTPALARRVAGLWSAENGGVNSDCRHCRRKLKERRQHD